MTDLINHPPHYISGSGIEAIDVIEAFGLGESFHLGNAVKYILRHQFKGHPTEDLGKACWYIRRVLSRDRPPTPVQPIWGCDWSYVHSVASAFKLNEDLESCLHWLYAGATGHDTKQRLECLEAALGALKYEIERLKGEADREVAA